METQSFSYNVKKEIISRINSRDKADVCLMGVLEYCNSLSDKEINFLTENDLVVEFVKKNICRILDNDNGVAVSSLPKKNGVTLYNVEVPNRDDRIYLLDYFRLDSSRRMLSEDLPKEKLIPQLVAGIFLACGSVNNPNKKYHMEFVMPTLDLCNDFGLLIIDCFEIVPKYIERKNTSVVYIKESENIIDMLTIMGASMASLEIMNVKMMKDVRNKINRTVNCDNANIEKSLRAAEKQINDIELISSTSGLDSLPDSLREMAEIRYENPDFNLKELGEALNPPISRSGANHRLARLAEVADSIRKRQTEKQKR